jgi:hypothetical protein
LTAVLYIALAAWAGARGALPELAEDEHTPPLPPTPTAKATPAAGAEPAYHGTARDWLYWGSGAVALFCLCASLLLSLSVFAAGVAGQTVHLANMDTLNRFLIWITLAYFISGTAWMNQWEKRKRRVADG